jgi:hypothetical protein
MFDIAPVVAFHHPHWQPDQSSHHGSHPRGDRLGLSVGFQIDTRNLAITSRKNWTHEFQRPVYFLRTRVGYVSGWCELDRYSEWLTLIPHPLSPASSRRWKYREEIENLGRVICVVIRLAE